MTTQDVLSLPQNEAQTASPFLGSLARLVRSEDTFGAWDKKRDVDLLAPFIVTKEARRTLPIIGDPDPDVLHRVEQLQVLGIFHIEKTGSAPDHEDLADFFFDCKFAQSFLGPFVAVMSEMDRTGMLIFLPGEGDRRPDGCKQEND